MKATLLVTLAALTGASMGATLTFSYNTAVLNSNPSIFSANQNPQTFSSGNAITGQLPLFSSANPAVFNLPKFDPSLGILTAVRLRLSDQLRATAFVENLDSVPTQATRVAASGSVFFGLDRNQDGIYQRPTEQPNVQSSIGQASTAPVSLAANDNSAMRFDGPDSAEFTNVLSVNSVTEQNIAASDFALFTETMPGDEVTVFVRATSNIRATGIGNNNFDTANTRAVSNVEVIYVFDEVVVPEPSSTLALGGLLGLGLFARRRR